MVSLHSTAVVTWSVKAVWFLFNLAELKAYEEIDKPRSISLPINLLLTPNTSAGFSKR